MMKNQGIEMQRIHGSARALDIRLGLRILAAAVFLAALPILGADLGRHATRLRLADTSAPEAASWSTAPMAGPAGGLLRTVRTPPYAANLPLPPLQVQVSGLPAGARVEVSAGGSRFVPVRLVNGVARLPVAVETIGGLRQLRFRIRGGDGMGQLTVGPERTLVLTPASRFTSSNYVVTAWGTSGDVEVRATDASGSALGIKSPDGSWLQSDGSGWVWLGRMDRGGQAAFSVERSNNTVYPVTVAAREGQGATVSRVAYAAGPEAALCTNPGKDGAGGTLTGVVNTYYPVDASVAAGATSIPVGSPQGASTPISAGDLLILMQTQGATIDASNTASYGDGTGAGSGFTALNGSGTYEYLIASGPVSGGSVPVTGAGTAGGTLNAYTVGPSTATGGQAAAQLIRVPQYTTATLGSGLTCLAWNGSVGGVLALDVSQMLSLGGTVSVDGKGFRGGAQQQLSGTSGVSATDYRYPAPADATTTVGTGGMKGEGIAGTPRLLSGADNGAGLDGYPNGDFGRGAPGNAGGGGNDSDPSANDENSGGGGGGNAGMGGQGGNTWNADQAIGGLPGAQVTDAPGLLVMGGGGGAGVRNNISAGGDGSGAAGGGIVMIRALSVSGSGTITANGADAPTSEQDGAGGGGAGGAILVYSASGGLGGLTVEANGGNGGDAWPNNTGGTANRHGPGGGGGGGAVFLSGSAGSAVVNGGQNGITTTLNDAYGATSGAAGTIQTNLQTSQIPGAGNCQFPSTPGTYITKTSDAGTGPVSPGQTVTYTITLTNPTASPFTNVAVTDPVPTGTTYVAGSGEITTTTSTGGGSYADSFPAEAYDGSTGTLTWSSPWTESGDDNSATGGFIRVRRDPLDRSNYVLRFANMTGLSISRPLDLSSYTAATLHFDYRRVNFRDSDTFELQVTTDGSTWQTVRTYDDSGTNNITDPAYNTETVDLTPYLSSNFALRFEYTSMDRYYWDYMYIDNVEIDVQDLQTTTNPAGDPPDLLTGYTLNPGQAVTITYQLTVNGTQDPSTTQITNSATLAADGGISQTASVSNALLPAPVVNGPIMANDTTISGTSTITGGTVTVYKNGTGTVLGTATVQSDGTWTLVGVSGLAGGDVITADVSSGGASSPVSAGVTVSALPALLRGFATQLSPQTPTNAQIFTQAYPNDPALSPSGNLEQSNFASGGNFPDQKSDMQGGSPPLVFYELSGNSTNNLRVTKGTDASGNPEVIITY